MQPWEQNLHQSFCSGAKKQQQQHKGNVKISLGKWVGGGIMPTKKSETYGE